MRIPDNEQTINVRVPMRFRKRGGRKMIVAADGVAADVLPRARIDNALIKAVARAFRWRRLIDTGVYASAEEIARKEKIALSYVFRILRLTMLSPEIIESILDGTQPHGLSLSSLSKPWSLNWREQKKHFMDNEA